MGKKVFTKLLYYFYFSIISFIHGFFHKYGNQMFEIFKISLFVCWILAMIIGFYFMLTGPKVHKKSPLLPNNPRRKTTPVLVSDMKWKKKFFHSRNIWKKLLNFVSNHFLFWWWNKYLNSSQNILYLPDFSEIRVRTWV